MISQPFFALWLSSLGVSRGFLSGFLSRSLSFSGGGSFGLGLGLSLGFGLGGLELLGFGFHSLNASGGIRASLNGLQGTFGTIETLELLPITGDLQQLQNLLGRLSADAEPVLSALGIDDDGGRLGVRVVGTDLLDGTAVTLLAGIHDHYAVERVELLTHALQTNLGCQNGSPCISRGVRFEFCVGHGIRNPLFLTARGVEGATRARITDTL